MNFPRDFFSCVRVFTIAALMLGLSLALASPVKASDASYRMDFDGDGKTDIGVYRAGARNGLTLPPSYFYVLGSQTGSLLSYHWGRAYDIHTPADYDGDGRADPGIFRWIDNDLTASASHFWINYSTGGHSATHFSGFGNLVSRNYFNDGAAEIAVFDRYDISKDPINPCFIWAFYIKTEGSEFPLRKDVINDCLPSGVFLTPAVGDYNNDGKSDVAVLFHSTSLPLNPKYFYVWYSPVLQQYTPPNLVQAFDVDYPIPGDYDGDGRTDFAGSKSVNGNRLWRFKLSNSDQVFELYFGLQTDYPVPGDYDGDGKTDIAVYRPSAGSWYILRSSDVTLVQHIFGLPTDIPLTMPNSNVYH